MSPTKEKLLHQSMNVFHKEGTPRFKNTVKAEISFWVDLQKSATNEAESPCM